jgi:hypothetical protein
VSIIAIDPSAAFPSEGARAAAVEAAKQTKGTTVGYVMVVLGDGFWASAIRGVLTTQAYLSRVDHPKKVVRHEEEAVDWAIEAVQEEPQKYRKVLLDALAEMKHAPVTSPSSSRAP